MENGLLRVELDDSTLALHVTDKRGGARWETPGAGLHLQTYDIGNQAPRWYTSRGADMDKVKYGSNPMSDCHVRLDRETDRRIVADVSWTALEIGLCVVFELEEDRLTVAIPAAGWDFTGEKAGEVLSLDCFPLFGGRSAGSDGYMVLPHFGGALRHFTAHPDRRETMRAAVEADAGSPYGHAMAGNTPDPDAPQSYAALAYGYQPTWRDLIAYPLWGTICGESGWAAFVPFGRGDADTAVVTSANQGPDRLCGVHGRFHYREHAHDERVDEDRRLVLTFLHDPRLNYATIGRLYRRHLVEEAGVPTLRAKCEASPATAYLCSAYYTRPMLALKRYHYINNPNPDGKGILDVYMSCDELGEELRRWKQSGVERALVQIVGANSEGHDGNYPTYFPLEPKVGGEEGVRRLIETIRELGYRSSVHVNFRCYMRPAPDFRIENILRDRDGGTVFTSSGPGGDDYNACPAAAALAFADRNFGRLEALGLDGGLYTDFLLGVLFRCYHPKHPLTRRGYLDAARAYLQRAVDQFGGLRTESVIAPILDLTDSVTSILTDHRAEACMRGAELTQRGLVDETVPLQPVIFHGIVMYALDNCCMGEKDYWAQTLTLAAIGGKPIEEMRGPQPQWDNLHALQYRVFCEQTSWLQCESIDDIRRNGDVTHTMYSDGTVVWVNHGNADADTEGGRLPGRSFRVIPGAPGGEEVLVEEDRSILDREPAICPDGSIWPDGRPREGAVPERGHRAGHTGVMIGQDFA